MSRPRPKRLLVAVLVAWVATAGCGGSDDPEVAPVATMRPVVQASEDAPVAIRPPVPPVPSATPVPDLSPTSDVALARLSDAAAEAEPTASTVPASMSASAPVRLQVPAIGVDSSLLDLGLQADGTLEVPPNGFPAGWYTGAPTPGELGPAIIAGHVDWAGKPGVFFDLVDLDVGDAIAVAREDGSTAEFRVTRVERFAKDEFPTDAVYGDLDHAGLRLITCGGDFDRQAGSYRDNVVVFAELTDQV